MDRRRFMQSLAALGLGSLATHHLTAEDRAAMNQQPVPRRKLGRTGAELSIIGFGGIIVMNQTPEESADYVARAVDAGVNYFDVAPSYGNAEERLGPALKPHRDKCFLACKTAERDGAKAEAQLHRSLELMQTDHFDLYQLHAITDVEKDVDAVFAPGGVMERLLKAREAGKIRHLGFSAHSEAAAQAALARFDFDTILFPFNYATWGKGGFGPDTFKLVREREMGLLALKSMARQKWPEGLPQEKRKWSKTWYEPLDDPAQVALALRFTLHLPVTAMLPPGHWELFEMALRLAQAGELAEPLTAAEQQTLTALAAPDAPIFETPAAA